MLATLCTSRSTRTSIVTAAAVALAALAGDLVFLDRAVATPYEQAVAALERPHFDEEITVRAPAAPTHFVRVR